MPPSLAGLSHVAVVVRDLAVAERFYVETLGLPVIARHADGAGAPRAIWVAIDGDRFLAIERGAALAGRADDAPGHHCLALRIAPEAREPWRSWLLSQGHPIVRETGFTLYVRDPDGSLVGLSHFPVLSA